MTGRRGEEWGWIGGWSGGFVWVVILAIRLLVERNTGPGITGLVLAGAAVISIIVFAPWRHQRTRYWKLMAPIYTLFFVSVGWAAWSFGGLQPLGLNVFLLLPLLLPVALAGGRKWEDTG